MNSNIYQTDQLKNMFTFPISKETVLRYIQKVIIPLKKKSSFIFNSCLYQYHQSNYNETLINEKAVEVPIALEFFKKRRNSLELGCVLPHYVKQNWIVIDKFEKLPGVINQDILNYSPKKKINQIVSISTLEHIGVDDSVTNKKLGIIAIEKLKTLLKKDGEMLVTIPIGYNPILDKAFIKKGNFDQVYAMKRVSIWNTWKQVSPKQVINSKYGWPYNNANAILIGYFKKP
jgi:hypothetical protein